MNTAVPNIRKHMNMVHIHKYSYCKIILTVGGCEEVIEDDKHVRTRGKGQVITRGKHKFGSL